MFKADGMPVSPMEVELCILQHPAVLEVVVVSEPGEQQLIKLKAFVVLNSGFIASVGLVKEIQDFTKSKLPPYKCPKELEFLQELPKSATGKIQRNKLANKGFNQ